MKTPRDMAVLLCALIALAIGRPAAADNTRPPNVLLIVSDDQRPDTIAALGNSTIQTPNLDRLVREGCAFTRATCANPICTPSRAEILTGCSGFRSGVIDFGGQVDSSLPTMAGWFANAGYQTVYVGKWHNDGRPVIRGYSKTNGLYRGGGGKFAKPQVDYAGREVTGYRGWIFQDDEGNLFPDQGVGLTADISRRFADRAIEVIDSATDQPLFLHVNFTAPHDPLLLPPGWESTYAPDAMDLPENFLAEHPFDHGNFKGRDEQLFKWPRTPAETRREIAAYYAVISHMDQQIGRVLDRLQQTDQLNNTIIVYSSDHGLSVGSHGLRGKQSMYEHTIGVPLVFRGPGVPAGQQRTAQCYLRDLFPTLCDLAGIEGPGEKIDGRSLKPVIDGKQQSVHPFIVGYFRHFQRMIRTDEWKYIEYPEVNRRQLFHLTEDPFEQNDLSQSDQHQTVRNDLRQQMVKWFKDRNDPVFE